MTDSNSVELFHVEFFLTENQTSKFEILLFWGFVLPSDFPKSGGDPVYLDPVIHENEGKRNQIMFLIRIHYDDGNTVLFISVAD